MSLFETRLCVHRLVVTALILYLIRDAWSESVRPTRSTFFGRLFDERIRQPSPRAAFHAQLADKYQAKRRVAAAGIPGIRVPTTFQYLTSQDEELRWDALPDEFVMKPTHFSGLSHVHRRSLSMRVAQSRYGRWVRLKRIFSSSYNDGVKRALTSLGIPCTEHHYDLIRPGLILEELVAHDGEWNYFVVDQRVVLMVLMQRCVCYLFDASGRPLRQTRVFGYVVGMTPPALPRAWRAHVRAVERLCGALGLVDTVRVDMYVRGDELYFGEFTFTPGACRYLIYPRQELESSLRACVRLVRDRALARA